ncbi:hypothetical protein PUNSTDRAFT_139224 [Punctularia strigosozonata HHB-11173 SS5]|uniref:DUF6534 domain-containing protein n=1 Tax=Punctularia strigosozonata (strain HHB-11173) TaxID=741275 RepID=R7S1N5_PUNST|nr:uncharacterized protein PUNSTDRAFT_139224 [Punctularia strigosozonata HHB-11173 SS5]EIN03692.1 hypothetical protein PUNSTDRAFT_139224 [Punctularia strigosozonata HHB-11173 SS5]
MIIIFHFIYWFLISNYSNPFALAKPVWSFRMIVGITALCDLLVRIMYLKRVWILSKGNILITTCIILFAVIDIISALFVTIKPYDYKLTPCVNGTSSDDTRSRYVDSSAADAAAVRRSTSVSIYVNFAAVLGADLIIALSLSWYLWHARTGFRRTDTLIKFLLVYVIGTGLLTVAVNVVTVGIYIALPTNYTYMAIYLLLPKLYMNSLLYSLNARDTLKGNTDGIISVHLSQLRGSAPQKETSGGNGDHDSDVERGSDIPTFDISAK